MNESQNESFEQLLKESELTTVDQVQLGEKYTGTVVLVGRDAIHVDIGMRSEAVLEKSDDERIAAIKDGDQIEVFIAHTGHEVFVSLDPILGHGDMNALEESFQENEPVEGKVESVGRGGYTVNASGVKCFCPISQISNNFVEDPATMIGQTLTFRVIEFDRGRKNVVLSRRVLLEEERREAAEKIRASIVEGAVLNGRVASIHPFGAFIDFGGIQGLLHISELAFQKVDRVEDVLSQGEELDVKIIGISTDNKGKERISLSRRALLPDPWRELNLEPGKLVAGTVARTSKFGIFITLVAGVDGLLPMRFLKKAGRSVNMEDFEPGQEVEVEVVEINHNDRKIALALPGWNEELKSSLKPGDRLKVTVVKILPVGLIVQGVEDPARGLVHKNSLKDDSMRQLHKIYPEGTELEVMLESIDERGRFNFTMNMEQVVDDQTIAELTDEAQNIGYSPFAAFYNKDE